ncbi:MAG: nuclear transport factor 2 family protein [Gemmatimonadales bacterium]
MQSLSRRTSVALRGIRWGAFLFAGLAGGAELAAQIPGDELPGMGRARTEYLAATYTDVKELISEWQDLHRRGDAERLSRLFTEDGLYSPPGSWYVQGRDAVADTLASRLPRVRNYHTSLIDFTASGGLVYYLGRVSYRLEGQPPEDLAGTFVMVLYQQGRRWRVRSYVERAG